MLGDLRTNGAGEGLAERAKRRHGTSSFGIKLYRRIAYENVVSIGLTTSLADIRKLQAQPVQAATTSLSRGRLTGPVRFATLIKESWNLSLSEMAVVLGYEPQDVEYVEDALNGLATVRGRDFKDRVVCLYSIYSRLVALFRNDSAINEWLREAQVDLGQRSPLQIMLNGSMEDLYRVRYFVERIAGR